MSEQMIFKRYEIKYMLTMTQFKELQKVMAEYMIPDKHGKCTNFSLYYDTPSFLLARRSMEGPLYKEKLRVRSYGVAKADDPVFIELKKKFEGVTYKRRISMKHEEAMNYLSGRDLERNGQIVNEIDYCFRIYKDLAPALLLSYDRQAYYAKDDHEFRMTFDRNILWRNYDVALDKGVYGEPLLRADQVLLEIKVAEAIPKWLVDFLSENHIYKTSFSKYVKAYQANVMNTGGKLNYA